VLISASLETDLSCTSLHDVLADLARYPEWLDIVARATPADAVDGDAGPAWLVDLRGQVGPFRRSKRLRMVRETSRRCERVRFVRREVDRASHSPWTLSVDLHSPRSGATNVSVELYYGGRLWVPVLDRVLRDEIERSKPRLVALAGAA
jgi:hypothetical protein